jgi:thiamine biosynthesis protein ThiI
VTGYDLARMQVVVHYGELALKGRNRPRFERRLRANLERALAPLGPARVRSRFGRLTVELPEDAPFEGVRGRLGRTFGVAWFARATLCGVTEAEIAAAVDALVAGREFASFGVRVRRIEKRHPFRSQELASRLGARVVAATGARVDLERPELWIEVHVLSRESIVLGGRIPGPGGMPVGSAGRVVALLSGGIDSPVAAALAMKRGAEVEFVHFHSAPWTSAASQHKVRDLVRLLSAYNGPSRLWLVPFGALQQALVVGAPAEPRVVLYRRFMLRIAERIAQHAGALALVTGESLSQVASQTLANLDTIDRAATLTVLRPLVGMDKAEIVERARALGSFPISIEPDEDCCSFLQPRRPATRTRPEELEAIERELDVKGLVDAALAAARQERIEPAP